MDDLINRDALLADIGRDVESDGNHRAAQILESILNAPSVEAEPVRHGQWIDHMVRDWRCSECGEAIYKVRNVDGYCYDDKPNYCPNCGTKMDKSTEKCS